MNRLLTSFSSCTRSTQVLHFANGCEDRGQVQLDQPHQLFTPEHYEPNYDYPLIVWLHSKASSEMELANVMVGMTLRNYVAVAPRGSFRIPGKRHVYDWRLQSSHFAQAQASVFETIQGCQDALSINSNRVFIAGYGSGGTMATAIALRHPEKFAGAISIDGSFPDFPESLVAWRAAKKLPMLWMHSDDSLGHGNEAMADMLRVVYPSALKVHPVLFEEESGLCTERLAMVNRFIMQIVTGVSIELNTANR